jgi:hypothetical protein
LLSGVIDAFARTIALIRESERERERERERDPAGSV